MAINKDLAGALGTIGGSSLFITWSSDIRELYFALYQHWELSEKAINSATNLSTDLTIIIGSAVASFIASWFIKNKPKDV